MLIDTSSMDTEAHGGGSTGAAAAAAAPVALAAASSGEPAIYDVYIGLVGKDPWLIRYAKWMQAELETRHSLSCFSRDRSISDARSTDIAVLRSVSHGVLLITRESFRSRFVVEELVVFTSCGNLVPVFFDVEAGDCLARDIVAREGEVWKGYSGDEKAWFDAVDGLLAVEAARRVEAHRGNWRDSIRQVAALVTGNATGVSESEVLPWPPNHDFVGREKELNAMEKILFPDVDASVAQTLARGSDASSKADADAEGESELARRSSYDGENHYDEGGSTQKETEPPDQRRKSGDRSSGSLSGLSLRERRAARAGRSYHEQKRRNSADYERTHPQFTSTCVLTGIPGIGKSELAVEFAYRHAQKYRQVLWVGGECRYLCHNVLNLSIPLRVDVSAEHTSRVFEEQEASAVHKVRQELETSIPYLLIIDNVDASRDSWDGRALGELLPRNSGSTHVIITTRLRRVMQFQSVELTCLSNFDAISLMGKNPRRQSGTFSAQQIDKLKALETELGRLPLGLALVGRIMKEFKLRPSELLANMDTVVDVVPQRLDPAFESFPSLVKLLDVCFDWMRGGGVVKNSLAIRLAFVGGWFAPAPCPLLLLAAAAKKLTKEIGGGPVQTATLSCSCLPSTQAGSLAVDASARLLIRIGIARASLVDGCLYFPDIVQAYCRMRGGVAAARCVVRTICKLGSVVPHYDHFWAAVYLVCRGLGRPESPGTPAVAAAAVVECEVADLLVVTRVLVMPLALRAFHAFSRCTAAAEVLRLWSVMLEDVEKSYVAGHQVDEYVWQDLTLVKAGVLESRAKLLLRGGQSEAGVELCRACIRIRTVMLGALHPDTVAAQDTLAKLTRARSL